jgi:opine dehydrogenase
MKESTSFAILGAGNGGHAMSADLTWARFKVNLFELERFKENIKPVEEKGEIRISGAAREGSARINMVTIDLKEAVEGVNVICIAVPAYGHMAFFEALAPCLEDGQIVVIWPNN